MAASLTGKRGLSGLSLSPATLYEEPARMAMALKWMGVQRTFFFESQRVTRETMAVTEDNSIANVDRMWFPRKSLQWEVAADYLMETPGFAELIHHFAFDGMTVLRRLHLVAYVCRNVEVVTLLNFYIKLIHDNLDCTRGGGWTGPTEVRVLSHRIESDHLSKLRMIVPMMRHLVILPGSLLMHAPIGSAGAPLSLEVLTLRSRWDGRMRHWPENSVAEACIEARRVNIICNQREPTLSQRLGYELGAVFGVEEFYWAINDAAPWMQGRLVESMPREMVSLARWDKLRVLELRFHYNAAIVVARTLLTVSNDAQLKHTRLEIFVSDNIGGAPETEGGLDVATTEMVRSGLRAVLRTGGKLTIDWVGVSKEGKSGWFTGFRGQSWSVSGDR
ncbi:hypothetical protein BDZ89DRAFT_530166 [Hymenopellis radicata]|nr:hypothetical protein BDZ89DRAFT_530166 [Hymenopellis radicata]